MAMRRAAQATSQMHLRLTHAKPCIDNAPPKSMSMSHLTTVRIIEIESSHPRSHPLYSIPSPHLKKRAKKHQLQEDRAAEIIRDNQKLLNKMTTILGITPQDEETSTHTDTPTPPYNPITSMTSAPASFSLLHRSKHERVRRQAAAKVEKENAALLTRLQGVKAFIDVDKMEKEYTERASQRAKQSKAALRAKVQKMLLLEAEEKEGEWGGGKKGTGGEKDMSGALPRCSPRRSG